MSDQDFFAELQGEFIIEALFLMENYEEHILGLESEENRTEHLAQIFRVAHSIKGGCAAVGFPDLGHFAHKVEDLLAILRVSPEFVDSEVISVLLNVGDEFKKRLLQFKENTSTDWDPKKLLESVLAWTVRLGGKSFQNSEVSTTVENELNFQDVSSNNFDDKQIEVETARDEIEDKKVKKSSVQTTTSVKVDIGKVDSVLDAVGEIVVLKNQLVHDESVKNGQNPRLAAVVDQLDKSVRELYEKTLGIRMTPLKSLFLKIQRIVRDVSLQLEKPINLKILGDETEVERAVFEMLGDPMVHLVRNALDHGVEKAEIRKEKNKNPVAEVIVSARQSGGQVIIEIKDDGGGINRKKIIEKAIEKNVLVQGVDYSIWTDLQVFQLLFAPGFSTAEKVSDLSGRGVGLDVVKSNIEKIQGKIEIESTLGVGSTFRLLIPLSTAITDGIVVKLQNSQYILPTYSIKEIVRVQPSAFTRLSELSRVVKIREALLSVIELGTIFHLPASKNLKLNENTQSHARRDETMLVIVETVHGQLALPVDGVIGQTQAVVKPFAIGEKIPEISGAAVLGDGSTVLIIDVQALVKSNQIKTENFKLPEAA